MSQCIICGKILPAGRRRCNSTYCRREFGRRLRDSKIDPKFYEKLKSRSLYPPANCVICGVEITTGVKVERKVCNSPECRTKFMKRLWIGRPRQLMLCKKELKAFLAKYCKKGDKLADAEMLKELDNVLPQNV